jgi:hypothetical protein
VRLTLLCLPLQQGLMHMRNGQQMRLVEDEDVQPAAISSSRRLLLRQRKQMLAPGLQRGAGNFEQAGTLGRDISGVDRLLHKIAKELLFEPLSSSIA